MGNWSLLLLTLQFLVFSWILFLASVIDIGNQFMSYSTCMWRGSSFFFFLFPPIDLNHSSFPSMNNLSSLQLSTGHDYPHWTANISPAFGNLHEHACDLPGRLTFGLAPSNEIKGHGTWALISVTQNANGDW